MWEEQSIKTKHTFSETITFLKNFTLKIYYCIATSQNASPCMTHREVLIVNFVTFTNTLENDIFGNAIIILRVMVIT